VTNRSVPKHYEPVGSGDNRVQPGRAAFVALTVLFVVAFRVVYIDDLSPLYSYVGLTYTQPSIHANSIIWLLALIPATFLSTSLRKPSHFVLLLLYICVYIPALFASLYMRLQSEFEVISLSLALFIGFALMVLACKGQSKPFKFVPPSQGIFWTVLLGMFFAFATWIVAAFGNSLQLVALSDVYSSGLRMGSRAIFDQGNVGFAVMMMMGSVNPLLIALGLQRQSKVLVCAGIAGQILCYSTGGFKSIVFSLLIIFLLHVVIRKRMRQAGHLLMMMAIAVFLICHLAAKLTERDNPSALILQATVSRALVMPGQLVAEYSDFFSKHPHLHLSNTKPFSWIFPNPLNDNVIFAITEEYEGDTGSTSNADFWAQDGLANFGLLGVVMISIVTGVILRIVDKVSVNHDPCFATMAFSFAAFNLSNAPLTTTLLSGGLMLSMVLMFVADHRIGRAHKSLRSNQAVLQSRVSLESSCS
jgi:hypothetical protein